jgi:hypothetical protein
MRQESQSRRISVSLRLINDRVLRAKFAEYRSEIHDVEMVSRTLTNVYYDLQAPFLNKHSTLLTKMRSGRSSSGTWCTTGELRTAITLGV